MISLSSVKRHIFFIILTLASFSRCDLSASLNANIDSCERALKKGKSIVLPPEFIHFTQTQSSWNIQLKDRFLIDFTDATGLLKLQAQIPGECMQYPPLFKISGSLNDKHVTFLLCGSCHYCPLWVYGQSLLATMASCRGLIVEDDARPLSRSFLEEIGALGSDGSWLEEFEGRSKLHVVRILEDTLTYYEVANVNPAELTPLAAYLFYLQGHNRWGMDKTLVVFFGLKNLKRLESLREESFKGFFPASFDYITAFREEVSQHVESGGSLNHPELKNFLGVYLNLDRSSFCDQSVFDENVARRNKAWIPKFKTYFDEEPTGLLAVVGYAHLFGKAGLLGLFQDLLKECVIQRALRDGQWEDIIHPASYDSIKSSK